MAEFFVLRKYRRCGIGSHVALEVWKRFPGQWEVRVIESHISALPFWAPGIRPPHAPGTFPTGPGVLAAPLNCRVIPIGYLTSLLATVQLGFRRRRTSRFHHSVPSTVRRNRNYAQTRVVIRVIWESPTFGCQFTEARHRAATSKPLRR